ncbi:MAG: trehalose-phosphatase [Thermoprotei archaeon]|nr:MAG: trehalose-phosphatase [Thermoprotei archaeon]
MPAQLFSHWLEVEGRLRVALGLFLMLDYDGTLTPIVNRPEEAKLSEETRKLLSSIVKAGRWVKVAIISGRPLNQLKKLIGIDGIYYAGLHGLEVEGPGVSFIHAKAEKLRKVIGEIHRELIQAFAGMKGIMVEDKGLSIAIHYRLAPKGGGRAVSKALSFIMSLRSGFRVLKGKKVYELMPDVDWDKGRAALYLIEATGTKEYMPIYIGDDETDEYAFKALAPRGLTIVVGRKKRSLAKFYVKGVNEVHELLRRINRLVSM